MTDWEPKVGGFIGKSMVTEISKCRAANTVNANLGKDRVGGFIGCYTGGIVTDCCFDKEKNENLNTVDMENNTFLGRTEGVSSNTVLINICEDVLGGHDYREATCKDKAVFKNCGIEYGEVDEGNCTHLVKIEGTEPSHLTEGNIEYYYCDGCGKYFGDEEGMREITLDDTILEKTPEHTVDESGWHFDANARRYTCACVVESPKIGDNSNLLIETRMCKKIRLPNYSIDGYFLEYYFNRYIFPL